jgi:hypothetical protein
MVILPSSLTTSSVNLKKKEFKQNWFSYREGKFVVVLPVTSVLKIRISTAL